MKQAFIISGMFFTETPENNKSRHIMLKVALREAESEDAAEGGAFTAGFDEEIQNYRPDDDLAGAGEELEKAMAAPESKIDEDRRRSARQRAAAYYDAHKARTYPY